MEKKERRGRRALPAGQKRERVYWQLPPALIHAINAVCEPYGGQTAYIEHILRERPEIKEQLKLKD